MEKDIKPNAMMNYMQQREQRFAAMSQAARRVKIDENHTWRLRLLPVEMGKDKEPFVDIAQHWWNKQPIYCPRHTTPAWGGDPEYPCPVCELSERLRESGDDRINSIGFLTRVNLKVRGWCVVFDMEDARGNVDDMPISEILNPYEFEMYKGTWECFAKFQKWALSGRRGGKEPSPLGVLDLDNGCDFLATQGKKGISLDKCDPSPIFPLNDPNFDIYIEKIWKRIPRPKIGLPSERQLLEVSLKIEEYAENGGSAGRGRGGRGRSQDDDRGRGGRGGRGNFRNEDDGDDNRGRSSRGRGRLGEDEDRDEDRDEAPQPSAREGRRRFQDDDAPTPPTRSSRLREPAPEEEAEPVKPLRRSAPAAEERPARREAPAAEEADHSSPPPRRNAPATARQAAPVKEPVTETPEEQEEQEQESAPPTRSRAASPTGRTSAPAQEKEVSADDMAHDHTMAPPARRSAPAAPPPARRSAAASTAAPTNGVDEEEDNAPEEKEDPAPAAREEIAEDQENDEAPPPVSAKAPEPRKPASDIKNRLARLDQKGR